MLKWTSILFAMSVLISQTAMDVTASLLVFTVLWMGWKWRSSQGASHRVINSIGFDWLLPIWIAVVALGFVLNWNSESAWAFRLLEFKWLICLYGLIAALKYLHPNEAVVRPAVAVFIGCCLYSILVFYIGVDPFRQYEELSALVGRRAGGPFSDPMTFAHVYGPVLMIFTGLLLTYLRWKDPIRWWVLAAAVIGLWAVALSGTRGVWISVSVGLLAMAFLFSVRWGLAVLLAGTIFMGLTYATIPSVRERISITMDRQKGYDSERLYIWQAHLEIFKRRPLLGVGYGETKKLLPEVYQQIGAPENTLQGHAHNQYLYFLAGTGVVGLTVYIGFLFALLFLNWKILKSVSSRNIFHQGLALGTMGSQVAFAVGGLTECNFEHSKVKYAMIIVWAIVIWLAYEYRVLKENL